MRLLWATAAICVFAFVLAKRNWPLQKLRTSLGFGDAAQLQLLNNACDDLLSTWIDKEAALSWNKIFEQTGPPAGARVQEGFVIASPSTSEPDYFYTWTRDSAIVTSAVLERLRRSGDTALESNLRLFAYSQKTLQHVCNPSGCFQGGLHGLGEPKFNVDGTAFTGSWGRPQRDGPALRAITLIGFAGYLLKRGSPADYTFIREHLYEANMPAESVIKADLEYVAKYWNLNSWDLWEEIDGRHFFTYIVSRTALKMGAALASRFDDIHAAEFYAMQVAQITTHLRSFVSPSDGFIYGYLDPEQFNRTGLDAAVPLGILIAGGTGEEEWGPANEHVLATIKAYVDSFRDEYKINKGEKNLPVTTGRYAEDVYDGIGVSLGNPWYLTTLSVSHVLSRALQHFVGNGPPIYITRISKPFWAQFDENIAEGEIIDAGTAKWKQIILALAHWSDGFWTIVQKYEGVNGQLDEQINRDTGIPQGAKNLTWSYAAFYLASLDRADACKAFNWSI